MADNFKGATKRGEISDVPVDEDQSFEAGVIEPLEDLHDGIDERVRLQGERAGPASRVPERTAVTQRG